jgi:hypothetical protein
VYQDRADGILESGIYQIISLVLRTWSKTKYIIPLIYQHCLTQKWRRKASIQWNIGFSNIDLKGHLSNAK